MIKLIDVRCFAFVGGTPMMCVGRSCLHDHLTGCLSHWWRLCGSQCARWSTSIYARYLNLIGCSGSKSTVVCGVPRHSRKNAGVTGYVWRVR